jgi:Zn-dependent peptidase ImmA (M78 family)
VLTLDRMAIENARPNRERLASAIHYQLQHKNGAVPVEAIAEALDIVDIRHAPLKSIEGALVMSADRDVGSIAVNISSTPQRRRFTVAHELGHFLNVWHQPEDPSRGFSCSRTDLATSWQKPSDSASRHYRQEAEANRFAIELLAPPQLVRPHMGGIPYLLEIVDLADILELSREATARRYVELHRQPTALVFSAEGVVRYVARHSDFPFVSLQRGQRLPSLSLPGGEAGLSAHAEGDPRDWLARSDLGPLILQTLSQREGYGMTLLAFRPSKAPPRRT